MPDLTACMSAYISYFPLLVLVSLLLAGFNLPLSEDLLIITSALVARTEKSLIIPLYAAIYTGVVVSDHIAYWIGTRIRKGLTKNKFFAKVLTERKLRRIRRYMDKFGIFTFIVCRFIPFGVRNTLSMGSGLMRFSYRNFALYDAVAALISTSTLFFLTYRIGASLEKPFKVLGIVLFVLLFLSVTALLAHLYVQWHRNYREKHPSRKQGTPEASADDRLPD